ncbi:MAG: hypothetical protein QGG40_06930 [Myxococcota bacterium]|nr:hypothetical protein [Myxococcota bacterium]
MEELLTSQAVRAAGDTDGQLGDGDAQQEQTPLNPGVATTNTTAQSLQARLWSSLMQQVTRMVQSPTTTDSGPTLAELRAGLEVPELPVHSRSEVTLEVADRSGSIELTVAKQASDVSVHLTASPDAISELKGMGPELAASLAKNGLSLSNFQARSRSDQPREGRSDRKRKDEERSRKERTGSVRRGRRDPNRALSKLV